MRAILRETAALVIRWPVPFVLLPWSLVGASHTALWAVAHFNVFRWLTRIYLDIDRGWFAYGPYLVIQLGIAVAVTALLTVLVDESGLERLRASRVTIASVGRRAIGTVAVSAVVAAIVLSVGGVPLFVLLKLMDLGAPVWWAWAALLFPVLPVWLLATQAVALPVVVIEGAGLASFARSWHLTRGFRWPIASVLGPFVALMAVLWGITALAVALPSCAFCAFPPPITALDLVIDIGGRSFTLGAGLGIATVMTTLIYRRLLVVNR